MYDVIIIGGGVIGCAIAHELARYQLKTLVVEKEMDVCEKTSMANSAIVHSGYDPAPTSMKAKMNVKSNAMFDEVCRDLDVEFKRHGSITLAFNEQELETLKKLQQNGKSNGVETILLSAAEVRKAEPFVQEEVVGGLLAPSCGIVNPFELTVALMENAMDNGVQLQLNSEVTNLQHCQDYYAVEINHQQIYQTRILINAAGLYSGVIAKMAGNDQITIRPRKGQYYVLDHFEAPFVKHTLFPCPSEKGKGVLVTPTTHGNYLIGPSSEFQVNNDYDDCATDAADLAYVKEKAVKMVKNIPFNQMIRVFAGERAVSQTDDFIIEEDSKSQDLYHVAGIQSPGLASSLAIATYVVDLIKKNHPLALNPNYVKYRRPLIRMNEKSSEEKQTLIAKNPKLGKIICRCEIISEAEVLDIIHRNCGATTIRGVKKRTRAGFGKCQGGFCEAAVLHILARELHQDPLDIRYGNSASYILLSKTKLGGDKR